MISPRPQDLTSYEFDFETYGFSPHQWEICVPFKDCVVWSIVLPYLRSADFKNDREFGERLKRLTRNELKPSTVKKVVLNFNPFLNMYACFFHETLKKIVQFFKNILDSERSTPKKRKQIDKELSKISSLLKCNILLINLYDNCHKLFKPEDDSSTAVAAITLFRNNFSKGNKIFSFGLTADLSWKLRESALNNILRNFEINKKTKKEIQNLAGGKEKKTSFVITLLKNNFTHIVFKLYESPYIAAKFANAGFATDPRIVDEDGLSALCYALRCSNRNLLYILYNYAANSCHDSENTFRDPNPCIISNLLNLEKIIEGDILNSKNFENTSDGAEQARLNLEDLRKFNTCLSKISKGILDIRKEVKQEDSKQKRIILHILEVFDEFFSIDRLENDVPIPDLIENYTKHKMYYDNLDFAVTLLFFDNIFLLKGKLVSPQPLLYSELESSFLLSTLANKYFTTDAKLVAHKYEQMMKIHDLSLETYSTNLLIIPLLERLKMRESIRNFCKILKGSSNMDIVTCIPEEEIHQMLYNSPEIKDEILIFRLHHYLSTALKTKSKSPRLSFVVERALQVIGESIKIEQENPVSFRHLLRSCLPKKMVNLLKQIRDVLSHLKNYQFSLKFTIEEDNTFFTLIQSELRGISKAFEIVYDIQRIRLIDFLINRGFANLKIPDNTHSLKTQQKDIKKELQRRISLSFEKKCYRYRTLWRNLFDATQEHINAIKNSSDSLESVTKNVNDIFHPLIYLATFLHNMGKIRKTNLFDDILRQVEKLHLCSSDIWETTEHLIGLFMDLLNSTDISVEEQAEELDISAMNIEIFLKQLMGGYISEEEKIEILGEIPISINNRIKTNETLVSNLKAGNILDLEQINKEIDNLFLNEHQKRNIKKSYQKHLKKSNEGFLELSLDSNSEPLDAAGLKSWKKIVDIITETPTPDKILNLIFEKKYVSESKLQLLYKEIKFSDKTKVKLSELMKNSKKLEDDNIGNLLNRISKLKKIAIDDRSDVQFLWEKAKSPQTINYIVYKIVQRYFRESTFQASLEMLWFDCVTILEEVGDFKDFGVKTSYLFNGIDVRNVLAHGDPLLESIGGILDPRDFPSELVKKMLHLLEDYESIKALHDIWKKMKLLHAHDFSKNDDCKTLRESIIRSRRWRKYFKLLTKNPKDSQTLEAFLS
ncbi:uncharacterized protein NPIL_520231 [Nephila pilipes]|uniref:Uncharacterized protein n=1 Tax=Nephila pilipes TaxID=299642 RepID=A0A8X6TEP0_NEPPI|nr:uncharacterized protein NPIL_520231 [Nephila pilipes]